jgi:CheY-like chemotaxis protein
MSEREISILVADDSKTVRHFIERALRATGRAVAIVEAGDGESAVRNLSKTTFDIAFVDINMPQFSGVEVQAAIKVTNSGTFCISMSDKLDEATETKLKAFGAYDFLPKPFTERAVRQVIDTWDMLKTQFDVLVVDDSATVRRIVTKVITRSIFNLRITEADSGEAALESVKQTPFRLIFSDFNMPGMSGVDLARELGRINRASDVILMSTEFSAILDQAAQQVGARAFLKKPFFPEDVDTILHHIFGLPCPRFSKQIRLFATT